MGRLRRVGKKEKQCWLNINWHTGDKFQCNLNKNTTILYKKMNFNMVSAKWWPFLSWSECVAINSLLELMMLKIKKIFIIHKWNYLTTTWLILLSKKEYLELLQVMLSSSFQKPVDKISQESPSPTWFIDKNGWVVFKDKNERAVYNLCQ